MATPRNARPGMLLDPGAPINQGLAGWWPMWEGAGGKTMDISGQNNTGTLTNGPVWAGDGLKFDGTNDHVAATNPIGGFTGTVFVVAKTTSTADAYRSMVEIRLESTVNPSIQMLFVTNADVDSTINHSVKFFCRDTAGGTGACPSGKAMNDGLFHSYAGVMSSAASRSLYVDGVLASSNSTSLGAVSFDELGIGGHSRGAGGNFFPGTISVVRVWNRALSALEVNQLHLNPNIGLWVPDITRYYIPAAGGTGGVSIVGRGGPSASFGIVRAA